MGGLGGLVAVMVDVLNRQGLMSHVALLFLVVHINPDIWGGESGDRRGRRVSRGRRQVMDGKSI